MTKLKYKIKTGDKVVVITGKFKGITGLVLSKIIDDTNVNKCRITVEGCTVKKHVKPSQADPDGGIKDIPAKIHISNVAFVANNDEKSKIGRKFLDDGTKVRYAKKTGEILEG